MPDNTDPTIAVVVVQWYIKPGREEDFLRDRKPVRRGTAGFIGEALYRAVVDGEEPRDDSALVFLHVMQWRSRDDFYRKHRHLRPDAVPQLMDYEVAPRRRHWLAPVE